MALADGQLGGARDVVEGVGRHGVVVCVVLAVKSRLVECMVCEGDDGEVEDVRCDVEEHAVGLAVAEGLALGVGLAESLAGREGVLGAGGFKVVCGCALYVGDDTAAWGTSGSSVQVLV